MPALTVNAARIVTPTASLRHLATLVIVASLPLTYAMTVRVVFPIKIYEILLVICVFLAAWEGRLVLAPGLGEFARPILVFLGWSVAVLCFRLAVPLDSFTTSCGGMARARLIDKRFRDYRLLVWRLTIADQNCCDLVVGNCESKPH